MEGPWFQFRREREPVSDIDIAVVDSLKALDPNRPIREADIQMAPINWLRSYVSVSVFMKKTRLAGNRAKSWEERQNRSIVAGDSQEASSGSPPKCQ